MPPRLLHFADPLPPASVDRPPPERAIGPPPLRTTWERYADADSALSIGEWACEPGAWEITFHARRHEFFHVLEGRLRIVDALGSGREFGPGDAGVIPAGFRGRFEVLAAVRKRYVMIDAASA
ncbi:MAG TPA: cupin domain-containing protein [Azospira sp.]|nr:cupin domain-containing protein [Azospira sp.]